MEADAISSAAIRSFYLKIGDLLNEKKIYQIFNKATDEEYEIYSKISGGTVFTNIETVMFDWKIRKAFSIAQIPDMERTSARYGEQIYNICKILLNEEKIQEKIKKYNIIIRINKNQEQEKILRGKINEQNTERQHSKNKMIKTIYTLIVPMFMTLILMVFWQMVEKSFLYEKKDDIITLIISVIVSLMTMVVSIISLNDITKEKRNRLREMNIDSKKLDEVLSEKVVLKNQFKQIEELNSK